MVEGEQKVISVIILGSIFLSYQMEFGKNY